MLKLEYKENNHNAEFFKKLLKTFFVEKDTRFLILKELDLVTHETSNKDAEICEIVQKTEHHGEILFIFNDFLLLLDELRTIYTATIEFYADDADQGFLKMEILDGDLFYVSSHDQTLLKELEEVFMFLSK